MPHHLQARMSSIRGHVLSYMVPGVTPIAPNLTHAIYASAQTVGRVLTNKWKKNKANLRDLISVTSPVILLKLGAIFFYFSALMTLRLDRWSQKTIGYLFYTVSSFVHYFKVISECLMAPNHYLNQKKKKTGLSETANYGVSMATITIVDSLWRHNKNCCYANMCSQGQAFVCWHLNLSVTCGTVVPRRWTCLSVILPYSTTLPEPMLTYPQCCPVTFIWGQFHERYLGHLSLKLVWKLHF